MFLKPELLFTIYRVVFSLEQVFTTASYIANRYSVGIRNMNLSSVPEDIIILNYQAQVDAGRDGYGVQTPSLLSRNLFRSFHLYQNIFC